MQNKTSQHYLDQIKEAMFRMPMYRVWIIGLLLCMGIPTKAQEQSSQEQKNIRISYSWEDFVEDFHTDYASEEEGEKDYEQHLLELKDLHEHPININTASVEDLLELPFLNTEQIEEIHSYIYLHGEMQTLGELWLLRLMDLRTIQYMSLFLYAQPSQEKTTDKVFSHLKNDFSTKVDIPLYYRKGYMVNNGYRGDPLHHRMRYELANTQHFRTGIRTEKDAGETYYDSFGAYLQFRQIRKMENIILGDYRIGFGEGLVQGGNRWFSKNAPSAKPQNGIRPMTGYDEILFMRGVAVTIRPWSSIAVSIYSSFRQQDAVLNNHGEIQTLLTSGLHRTESEENRKRNYFSTVIGGNITWQHQGFHLGATGYYRYFDKPLNPGKEPYRSIYPKGNTFGVAGLHYGYSQYRLTLAGETAYSTEQGGWATLHRATYRLNRDWIFSAIQRFYAHRYYSFYATALAENSTAQNESGLMIHLQSNPWEGWQLVTYVDFFHHPWARYGMTHSSSGQESMVQMGYKASHQHTFTGRYTLKRKERYDAMEVHHRAKLQWNYTPREQMNWRTTLHLHQVGKSNGWAVQESFRYSFSHPSLRFSGSVAYFHTNDYKSSIYLQEPSLYNSFSSATHDGKGLHAALTGRWTSNNQQWMIEGKYTTKYFTDRKEQSSGLQTIFGPWKNDISMQIRIKL